MAVSPRRPAAVTFDFWNTLAHDDEDGKTELRLRAWQRFCLERNVDVAAEAVAAAFAEFNRAYIRRRQRDAAIDPDRLGLDVLERLRVEFPRNLWPELVDVYCRVTVEAQVTFAPGLEECLATLRAAGVRAGVVSNVIATPAPILRCYMARAGVLHLFDALAFSDEVGAHKPDAAIFDAALAGLGGPVPASVVHVGDSSLHDVAGARAAGMRTARFTGFVDDAPEPALEADYVVDSLEALLEALSLSRRARGMSSARGT
jgi:HAD superfamily hydrolase (TIGR01509 family)